MTTQNNSVSLKGFKLLLMLGVLLVTGSVWAASWSELSDAEREVLGPYESTWSELALEHQKRLTLGAQRWLDMDSEQRGRMRSRFDTWQALPGDRQALLMQRLDEFRELTPDQQRQMRDRFRIFNDLSPNQKKRLRNRFDNLPARDRARALERLKQRARNTRGGRSRPDSRQQRRTDQRPQPSTPRKD